MLSSTFLLNIILFSVYLLKIDAETVDGTITNNQIQEEINYLKSTTKFLSDNLEKWNNLFLNSLEHRMISTATSLANIDSNINSLQERAHVWDTFQLHIAAWNDQLATLDRKADIISKGQEKLLELEAKLNSVANIEHKMDDVLKRVDSLKESVSTLKEESQHQYLHKNNDNLFNEFATRGILSTVKMIEKKLDRLLVFQQNSVVDHRADEKPKLTIKCNTPRFVEELLKDISSKVDVIFDKISGKEISEGEFATDDYLDDGSGSVTPLNLEGGSIDKKIVKRSEPQCNIEELIESIWRIENISLTILNRQDSSLEEIQALSEKCTRNFNLLDETTRNSTTHSVITKNKNVTKIEANYTSCEDLDEGHRSGVYIFWDNTVNSKNRTYNERYCYIRDNTSWTVIQRRENSIINFNLTWLNYKNGFGDLNGDFWLGNDFISKLSNEGNLVLRIELEDFEGNQVWAEYKKFLVLPEESNYQLIIGGYRGNASDSFLSHNGSFFSTFDRRNDQAPQCCPCAVSFGAGWWFNSCFESNLNGVYFMKGDYNGYYGGIIWENWKGNQSLRKTLIMVRNLGKQKYEPPTLWPYYEDP